MGGAQNQGAANVGISSSHSQGGELITGLQRSLIEMSFGRNMCGVTSLER